MTELQFPVPPLTDAQRAKVIEFFSAEPDGGAKRALAHAGIHATQTVARATIAADDELAEHVDRVRNVAESTLIVKLGAIATTDGHKDQLNAIKYALAVKHGYREKSEVAVTDPDGGALKIIVESAFPREPRDDDESGTTVPGEPETS